MQSATSCLSTSPARTSPGANLTRAKLARAYFDLADARAHLRRISSRANPDRARLTRARLSDANLTRAIFWGANLTRANLDGAIWPEGVRVPEGWMVDDSGTLLSGRLKRAGQLSEVMAHYL